MSFTEDFGKKVREDEAAARAEQEPQRVPLGEVLRDERQSRLFAAYLEHGDFSDAEENAGEENLDRIRLDKKSLGEKIFRGEKLTEADVDALYEETGKFFAIKERADAVRQRLAANKEALVHASPKLREIVELAGPDVLEGGVLERFDEIAFTHPEILASLEAAMAKLDKAEESIAIGNERMAMLCKEYHLTEDEYKDALRRREDGDPYALEDLVKRKMTLKEKIKNKFTSYEAFMNITQEDLDRRPYIKEKLAVANESLGEMGTVLRDTLFKDPEAKGILEANLERKANPEKKMTFDEARVMFSTPLDADETRQAWQEYQTAHAGDPNYDEDRARKVFSREYATKKTSNKKGGFWATVFHAFFAGHIEDQTK